PVDAKGPSDSGSQTGHNGNGNGKMDLANVKEYLRYAFAKDGISPRSRPGVTGGRHWITSDEHDPDGHITEGVEMRVAMMNKRMNKRSEEHTSELQSRVDLVCRLLLEKKKKIEC